MALRPFRVALRPSRLALALSCLFALWLALTVLLWGAPSWVLVLDGLLLCAILQREGWLPSRQRPRHLDVSLSGVLSADFADGTQTLSLSGRSWVTPWLCVLIARTHTRRVLLPLWPDSADADALRKLRVYLRWQPEPPLR
ncbi:protein YgfX [Craterilacuibacter sp.]|uniref:protein YgfX n=1 Tax=Craterilacuibacter sp. TaxID=2870909 RepID=UPI003F2DBC4B